MAVAEPRDSTIARGCEKPFGCFEIAVQLIVELLQEFMANRDECRGGVHHQHQRQNDGIPSGELDPNGRGGPPRCHGSPSRKTNPTPRTV